MGRNPFRPKAPVTWPHRIEPRRGRVGKARRVHRSKQAKLNGKKPAPLLQIIKNT